MQAKVMTMRPTTYTVLIGRKAVLTTKNCGLALVLSNVLYHCFVPVALHISC